MSLPNLIKITKVRKVGKLLTFITFQGGVSVSTKKRPLVV